MGVITSAVLHLEGRIISDVALHHTGNNTAVISLDVAVNYRGYKNSNGEDVTPPATRIRVTAWRGVAEYLARNAKKGQGISGFFTLTPRETTVEKDGKTTVYHSLEASCINGLLPSVYEIEKGSSHYGFADLNITGRAAVDADLRHTTKSGKPVTGVDILVNRPKRKNEDGTETEFPPIRFKFEAYEKDAEYYAKPNDESGVPRLRKGTVLSGVFPVTTRRGTYEKDGVTHVVDDVIIAPYKFAPTNDLFRTAKGDGNASSEANEPATPPRTTAQPPKTDEDTASSQGGGSFTDWAKMAEDAEGGDLPW